MPVLQTIRNNFTLPTLLLTGACLQSLIYLILPFRYALLPAFLLLVGQVVNTILVSYNCTNNPYMKDAKIGKHTAQIPNADGSISQKASDKNVVGFMIGAVSHSPLGIFDPDFRKVGDYFRQMTKEAEADPIKWGLLGTGHQSLDIDPSRSSNGSIKTLTISYWRSIEHLHAFAQSPLHREGWAWWDEYRKHRSDVGIYHETYFSPRGSWETIYENCHRFGLANIKIPIDGSEKEKGAEGRGRVADGLVEARQVKYTGMGNRMGRNGGIMVPDE